MTDRPIRSCGRPSRPSRRCGVRFPPSPTGFLHVGNARSALFNWAFARHYGGTLVLRIEDTDLARNTHEGYASVLDSLRWLGIDWDEGPEVGGPYGPYLQSERFDTYADIATRLREAGRGLRLLLHHRRGRGAPQGGAAPRCQGYDGHCRELTAEQRADVRGRGPHVPCSGCGCPTARSSSTTWSAARSPSCPRTSPTSCWCAANGDPLYTLVNPVDDALMGITHVLRGEDLLSETPRQIALYDALAEHRHRHRRHRASVTCRS